MKNIVKQRSYEAVKRLSPKRRKSLSKKIRIRSVEVETTCRILFETGILTYGIFQNLDNIYRTLINEWCKLERVDSEYYIKHKFKKDEILIHSGLGIEYSKQFKKTVLGKRSELYPIIENLVIDWTRDNETAGSLTRNILTAFETNK